ncbi:MAG: sigma-70 family RNA polymerase sigma factor [Muribaculaceae bacterium]|nr:sigma-70 family RNA polymerase sigma factor [Muribaculaceae bacterium]
MKSLDLNIDNQTLVEECRRGDRDAMSILYTRFAPRMLHVIERYVTDSDSAQDILHDGFIAAFTRLDTVQDPKLIDFWLATIMKNLSLKYLQAQTVTSILEEIPETSDDTELDDILDFATIESLIRKLPDGYQKVFRLAVLEGKSHKEISKILGIAPNSSSSQLFHAKLRLRELIKDYQLRAGLISLLILILSSGIFFIARHSDLLHTPEHLSADANPKILPFSKESKSKEVPAEMPKAESKPTAQAKMPYTSIRSSASFINDSSDDSVSDAQPANESATQSVIKSDSTGISTPSSKPEILSLTIDDSNDTHHDQLFALLPNNKVKTKNWSASIYCDAGAWAFDGLEHKDYSFSFDMDDPPIIPPDINEPKEDGDKSESEVRSRMPRYEKRTTPDDYLNSFSRRHHLPISFALVAEKHFSSWLGLESGVVYSYLHTDFERYSSNGNDVATCHWHYLGFPLKVNLYAYTTPRLKLYFGLGGKVDIPIYSRAQIAPNPYCQSGRFDSKVVWSAGTSVGVAFRLSKRVDIFIEPSLRYHFPQECDLPNIWTDDEPWSISIPIGFRFNW